MTCAAALRGKAAIANTRLAYQRYEQAIATGRWKALEKAGARPLMRPSEPRPVYFT